AASHQVRSALREGLLRVAAPVISQEGRTQMVALVYIATDSVQQAIRDEILRALLISLAAILVGVLISILFSRGITRPVAILTDAASALEADNPFNSERLVALAANGDELGKMARVFARMAKEIHVREDRLKSQVAQLKIEIDEAKRARQVQEITDTDYFQNLRGRAQQLRTRKDE
ncbi:MAG TPA: HAMP domain-containing protein, partial [Chloroflexota bacterium]|nr:HAMP domain-containing protein [Chloroflexota bacterium]